MEQPKTGLKGLDSLSQPSSYDLKSRVSLKSKQSTLTKEELQKYFKEKKEKLEEDKRSRLSLITRSHFSTGGKSVLDRLKNDLPSARNKDENTEPKTKEATNDIEEEEIEEMSYKSEESEQNQNFDAPTVATSIMDQD
jgi:DNA polymerase III alpha subunit (gram-positive type)